MASIEFTKQQVRLPPDVKVFLREQAEFNCSSENSEIVRALRAKMDTQKRGREDV